MIGKGQGHENLTRICLDEIVMECLARPRADQYGSSIGALIEFWLCGDC
jgi:hypothetical protein